MKASPIIKKFNYQSNLLHWLRLFLFLRIALRNKLNENVDCILKQFSLIAEGSLGEDGARDVLIVMKIIFTIFY